jgi:hypothetical protein
LCAARLGVERGNQRSQHHRRDRDHCPHGSIFSFPE